MGKVIETVADSIAIEILDGHTIITGKGNELHLFVKHETKENVVEQQILDIKLRNKIHGIKKGAGINANILLVYGEKEFVLLEYNKNCIFKEFYRAELSDWISSGLFLNDGQQFVLLTAHSIVLRFVYDTNNKSCSLEERVSCTDKSTLYCSHLFGLTWRELIVFAGNAFGELLIWQPSVIDIGLSELGTKKVAQLLHRIAGHNGVIFSIDYDPDTHYLITTSDDRAVKWWKVTIPDDDLSEGLNWSNSKLQAIASGYGHVARVFQGRIIKDGSHVYALSVGEDSYFCLWSNTGELLYKRRQQYGATIWNFVYDNLTKTIYTIGSIGNLVAYGLRQKLLEIQQPQNDIIMPQVTEDKATSTEYIAKVKFLSESQLIGITNQNRLKTIKINGKEDNSWNSMDLDVDFKCTVMEVYDNLIAICGFKRMILLEWLEGTEEFKTIYDQQVCKGVVRTFVFLNKDQFLICDDQGNCIIFMNSMEKILHLELPKCKEPWVTSALILLQDQYIVMSNRLGNLLLYKLSEDNNSYTFKDVIKHPHGNLGATNIEQVDTNENFAIIRTSGHDGAINLFSINFKDSTFKTCSRQIIPVAWVESITNCFEKLELFLGFNDNHFVVWNQEYDFLLQLPCGGGHRSWHFLINPENSFISLVFIKNKRVRFHKLPLLNKELTQLPLAKKWHIAPCNIMELIQDNINNSTIAVTAGDDNLIKVHIITPQGLIEERELHTHISNIRALKVLSINDKEFLIFSGGGRAQLCITKVNKLTFHVEELINFTLKQESDNKSPKNKTYNFDPETRLMSMDVKKVKNNKYHLYIGCSDGFIRHLSFNLTSLQIEILTHYFYNKCVLQIKYIAEMDYVLAGATDGLLRFFEADLKKCLYELPHHSSGINGLSVLMNPSKKSLQILTGGDDQAVTYSELSLENFKVLNTFTKPYLHTAQVCASTLASNGLYGFTSGVDQNLFKLDLSTGEVVDSFHSCVADIKGVGLVDDRLCLLYGCGLQIYAFDS